VTVECFAWNPTRPVAPAPLSRWLPMRRPVNNFGDLLGPLIVERLVRRLGLVEKPQSRARLLSVGSVLHFAGDGDVVWGTGRNGKVPAEKHEFTRLDVRAVRGPLTRDFLRERGHDVPPVYGDPGLLVGELWPELTVVRRDVDVTVVPNFHEASRWPRRGYVNPRSDVEQVLRRIARSALVVGSSLHGIIVAESLGIPARLTLPRAEVMFKYADYYAGTGRADFTPASSVAEAIAMGGEPGPRWDSAALLAAFPRDLWASS
jgi:pyruvyltransferase